MPDREDTIQLLDEIVEALEEGRIEDAAHYARYHKRLLQDTPDVTYVAIGIYGPGDPEYLGASRDEELIEKIEIVCDAHYEQFRRWRIAPYRSLHEWWEDRGQAVAPPPPEERPPWEEPDVDDDFPVELEYDDNPGVNAPPILYDEDERWTEQ